MHCNFNLKEFQACFSTFFVCCRKVYFTWEQCVLCGFALQRMQYFAWEKCVESAFKLHRMRVERRLFYPMISKESHYVQHCTCTQKVAIYCMFNKKEFQACFSTFYFTWEYCIQCGFAFQRMRVERRLFYPKISKRSYYVKHCTCTQKVAMHSMFNIKQFQACF